MEYRFNTDCNFAFSFPRLFRVQSVAYMLQERYRFPGRFHGVVTMPAQLDMDAALVPDLVQHSQHWNEIDLAFTEHQVLVNSAAHVFDMNVPETIFPTTEMIGDRYFPLAV